MRAGLGVVAALAALAAAGRIAFTFWPNVALTYVIVFAAGIAFGARAGAMVGALAMLATDLLLTGFHPVLLVNSPAMALLGALGGVLGRGVDFGQRSDVPTVVAAPLAALIGVLATVAFSVAADVLGWAMVFLPSGGTVPLLRAQIVAGLAFNAVPAAVNAVLFAVALRPTLSAARKAGLLRGSGGPTPRPGPHPAGPGR